MYGTIERTRTKADRPPAGLLDFLHDGISMTLFRRERQKDVLARARKREKRLWQL